MNDPATPSRAAAANSARRRDVEYKVRRVQDVLKQMRREQAKVTYPAVARRAEVSRSFLYENDQARVLMEGAVCDLRESSRRHGQARQSSESEPSWRERALNAEEALKAAYAEIRTQRDRIGRLIGQLRDLEQQMPADTIERVSAENSKLKQRARELSQENRTLEERLQAARSNARFADRKIAQLEAQLLELQQ